MSKEAVIQVDSLVKKYGDLAAVNGVSFTVNRGEIFSFVGPNGAGKTTTVEILVCLRNLTAGKAKVLGFDVSVRQLLPLGDDTRFPARDREGSALNLS
jgi:ABC-2 type transport system ATP-binding protein